MHRGQVIDAYRTFLGVMENTANRKEALAELVFSGMIDVQDRMLWNRSYTTGHKAYRARSTVEIGNAIGWDNAHHVLYAGALDIAVGPRWYSTYEMACNCVKMWIEGEALHAVPYGGVSEAELATLGHTDAVNQEESAALIETIIRGEEMDALKVLTQAPAGRQRPATHHRYDPARRGSGGARDAAAGKFLDAAPLLRVLQHAGLVLRQFRTPAPAAAAVCRGGVPQPRRGHQRGIGDVNTVSIQVPSGADRLTAGQLLDRVDAAVCGLSGSESLAWTQAYCDNVADRGPLVERIALAACKLGNDPHNQEIAQCMLMDFGINQHPSATSCCSRRRITPRCTANTATRWSARAGWVMRWRSPSCGRALRWVGRWRRIRSEQGECFCPRELTEFATQRESSTPMSGGNGTW